MLRAFHRERAKGYHETALLGMLEASPNALITTLMLLVVGWTACYGSVSKVFLIGWTLITFGLGTTRYALVTHYVRLNPQQREANRSQWIVLAKLVTLPLAVMFSSLALFCFPQIDHAQQLAISMLGASLMMGSVGFMAVAGSGLLFLTFGTLVLTWALYGGTYALQGTVISLTALLYYLRQRRLQADVTLNRIALAEQTRGLSDEVNRRNGQLELAHRDKKSLVTASSHFLREPVHALGMLLAGAQPTQSREKRVASDALIAGEIFKLSIMLNALTDEMKLDLGEYELRPSRLALDELLREFQEEHALRAMGQGLSMQLKTSAISGLQIFSDRALLQRILGNLVVNAIKFTQKGFVHVEADRLPSGAIQIAVVDSGIGIAPEHWEDIFRAYVRVHGETDALAGLGLGLSIAKKGARLLGCEIGMSSRLGEGSRFTLTLPAEMVCAEVEVLALASAESDKAAPVTVPHSVLVVEDDGVIRMAMLEILDRWGYRALGADSLQAALALLKQNDFAPDIVLSDYRLSEIENGLDCIQSIRAQLGRAQLPAVVLTGDVNAALDASMDSSHVRLLHKPVRPRQLQAVMQGLLVAT